MQAGVRFDNCCLRHHFLDKVCLSKYALLCLPVEPSSQSLQPCSHFFSIFDLYDQVILRLD